MHIMHSQEMCTDCLLRRGVINVGASDAQTTLFRRATTEALAAFFNGAEVFRVYCVAEVLDSVLGYGIAEALNKLERIRV